MRSCNLCAQRRKLIKAHIIPHAFYPKGENPRSYDIRNLAPPKRIPMGHYDQKILCAVCDNALGQWDHEAVSVLRQKSLIPVHINGVYPADQFGNIRIVAVEEFNYYKLKLFFVSLLWRASITKLTYFSKVNLGPQANELRDIIVKESYLNEDEYSIFVVRYAQDFASSIGENPRTLTIGDATAVRFMFGGYIVYINVSNRRFPSYCEGVVLKPDSKLYMLVQDIYETSVPRNALKLASGYGVPPDVRKRS